MAQDIWINLPVRDLARSTAFFTKIGFVRNPGPGNTEHSASFVIGEKKVVVMLFVQEVFSGLPPTRLPTLIRALKCSSLSGLTVNPRWMRLPIERSRGAVRSLPNLANRTGSCTVAASATAMVIDGTFCSWTPPRCSGRHNTPARHPDAHAA